MRWVCVRMCVRSAAYMCAHAHGGVCVCVCVCVSHGPNRRRWGRRRQWRRPNQSTAQPQPVTGRSPLPEKR